MLEPKTSVPSDSNKTGDKKPQDSGADTGGGKGGKKS